MALEDWLSKMYEKDVVIRKNDGYHYGRLCGYDGKFLYLDRYYFSKKPMGYFECLTRSFFGKDAMLRAENIISIMEGTGPGEELFQSRRYGRFFNTIRKK